MPCITGCLTSLNIIIFTEKLNSEIVLKFVMNTMCHLVVSVGKQ